MHNVVMCLSLFAKHGITRYNQKKLQLYNPLHAEFHFLVTYSFYHLNHKLSSSGGIVLAERPCS